MTRPSFRQANGRRSDRDVRTMLATSLFLSSVLPHQI
jgi:hypothetical protein